MLILSFILIIYSLISLLRKVINEIVLLRKPFFSNYLNSNKIVLLREPSFSDYLFNSNEIILLRKFFSDCSEECLKSSTIKCLKEA